MASEEAEPRPFNGLSVRLSEHWAITGKTGSGKTRFSLALLEYYRRQYPKVPRFVLNSTDDDMPEIHAPRFYTGNRPPSVSDDPTYTHVWVPDSDDLDAYDYWLSRILYRRKPAIVLIDEVASFGGDQRNPPPLEHHTKIMKQGRKKGITIINEVQEIAKAPPSMFRQATWFVQFRIGVDPFETSSARRLLDIPKEEYHQPRANYGFHVKRLTGNYPTREYNNLTDLFGSHFRI